MQTTVLADPDDLNARLLPGEKLLWSGQPGAGVVLTSRDVVMIPFSLIWAGFAVFWEYMVSHSNAPPMFRLWGIPFIAAGLYFVAGRFVFDAWIRRRIRYAVTTRRILIQRPAPFRNFTAVDIERLPNATLTERADGSGSIRFGAAAPLWGRSGMAAWTPALDPTPQFLAIANARQIFDLIQRQAADRG